jgi:hypothetical protein
VFTHYRHDLRQNHRLICDLTWNTFRNQLILEYEIPKYDGDLGNPNAYVQLSAALCQQKINRLLEIFETQRDKSWFTENGFWELLRLRGMEYNAPENMPRHSTAARLCC